MATAARQQQSQKCSEFVAATQNNVPWRETHSIPATPSSVSPARRGTAHTVSRKCWETTKHRAHEGTFFPLNKLLNVYVCTCIMWYNVLARFHDNEYEFNRQPACALARHRTSVPQQKRNCYENLLSIRFLLALSSILSFPIFSFLFLSFRLVFCFCGVWRSSAGFVGSIAHTHISSLYSYCMMAGGDCVCMCVGCGHAKRLHRSTTYVYIRRSCKLRVRVYGRM